ncbi:MAG: hypothetical protein UHD07_04945 [Ruminobacter sp.]|jgi:uncharacterized membrane protein|nr:hypothetical protein [Ruminobacter sp.]
MKIIIKAPLWTKILYYLGFILMFVGICSHFFNYPEIPDKYMAYFLIGGVILIIPYQYKYLYEILKYRPKE